MLNIDKSHLEVLEIITKEENITVNELISITKLDAEEILTIMGELKSKGLFKDRCDNNNSYLDFFNAKLHKQTLKTKTKVEKERHEKGYVDFSDYNINKLKSDIFSLLEEIEDINTIDDLDIQYIDRKKFDADLCLKIPTLLQEYKGAGNYIKKVIPKFVKAIEKSYLFINGTISNIEVQGIYINITLGDNYLFESLKQVLELNNNFGESDINKSESIVVDYSSPNAAKHLHAGHIRSTIIGHVLSNLYDATGYNTHRVNHMNDWGGFGYLIEGYEIWKDLLPTEGSQNDKLFFIYTIFRKGEKASSDKEKFSNLDKDEIEQLKKYYGNFSSFEDFVILFNNFFDKSKKRFSLLEKGNKKEVDLWEQMVLWSKEDFNKFYDILGIKQDYTIGESFYSNIGRELVLQYEKEGKAVFYTQDLANKDIELLESELKNDKISNDEFKSLKEEIKSDIGCYLIKLPNFERFVVLKSDGSTIYATRDLAAISYRNKVFGPSRIVYEVGQEQAEHFDKLFKSSIQTGIEGVSFSHIYHGFYVDSETKSKLSSRDGASNVQNLIEEAIKYFEAKYDENDRGFSENEIKNIAYKLAIGSIIFNDIKKDKKSPVSINKDINKTCKLFEQSGGANIAYSVCRANSIIKKYGKELPKFNQLDYDKLEDIEKLLINEINNYPIIVSRASLEDNPAVLADYLLKLSKSYSSYYNAFQVLNGGSDYRLLITQAVIIVLTNGMRLCHIEIPDKI